MESKAKIEIHTTDVLDFPVQPGVPQESDTG